MTLSVRLESIDSLWPEWQTLALAAPTGTVFSTPSWMNAWWQGQRTDQSLELLAFRRDGSLVALAPMMRSADTVRFLAATDVCDYHDCLYLPGLEDEFYPALAAAIEQQKWPRLELEGIVESSPSLRRLTGELLGKGWTVEQEADGVSPEIVLPERWDGYLESLGGKDRHELRRKLRKLSSAGQFECYDAVERHELSAIMTTFVNLMRSSREDKAEFLTPEREQFFRILAEAMRKEGWLRIYYLTLDTQVVAASMLFDFGDGFYLYNSGFDTRYTALSVGLLVKALCMKDAIEKGKRRFNFLRGAEPYKYSLGAQDLRLYKLTVRR